MVVTETENEMASIPTPRRSTEWAEVDFGTDVSGHCDFTNGCPCCTCGEESSVFVTYIRKRWSKSGKRHVPETRTVYLCLDHSSEDML